MQNSNLKEFGNIRPLLKPAQIAEALNICRSHVYNLIATGELPSVEIGRSKRVRPEDLEAFIDASLNKPFRN